MEPRPEIAATPLAEHGGPRGSRDERAPVRIDFSASLNAWGPASRVVEAARAAPLDHYPDPECLAPRRAAAARWGVPLNRVVFGAGAAELLHAACFALVRPGDAVLLARPTFGEYARSARLCGARVREVRAAPPRWLTPLDEMTRLVPRVRPRLVFLCAPNNPTGERIDRERVRRLADACAGSGALLVLDQSYDAFLEEPLGTPPLPDHPALLCVRSITKDHALAGVRAAFAVAPAEVASALERARVPWAAATPAQAAAVAALSGAGDAHLRTTLPRLRAERKRVENALAGLGIPTVPTATHFLLAEVGDAQQVARGLRDRYALAVRDCSSFGLPRHVRLAARRPRDNDVLLAALGAECSS